MYQHLADELRLHPSVQGRVSIPVALATKIEVALREASEFVPVPRISE